MEINDIEKLICFANNLSEGRDPLTGKIFEQDTLMNSPAVKAYNKRISEILKQLSKRVPDSIKRKLEQGEIFLDDDSIENFHYDSHPISISKLCNAINHCSNPLLPNLRGANLTEWLFQNGYLSDLFEHNEKKVRFPTKSGEDLGIVLETRETDSGEIYLLNTYSLQAQRFILEKINEIYRDIYQ